MTNQEILNEIEEVMNTEHYRLRVLDETTHYVAEFFPCTFFNFNENFINELRPVVKYVRELELKNIVVLIKVYKTYADYINEELWKSL